jgi:hypothetical protein
VKIAYSSQPTPATFHHKTNNEQNIPYIEQSSDLIQEMTLEITVYAGSNCENIFSRHFFMTLIPIPENHSSY